VTKRALLKCVVALALIAVFLPAVRPAHAATAAIGQFYAGCGNFSVDVAVFGTTDDGGGQDRFWYSVTDATGKKLYEEYATRQVNTTGGSLVVNLSYDAEGVADGAPTQNPIKIRVLELDSNNNLGAELASATYDAPCLPASNNTNRFGLFAPPKNIMGTITGTTALFLAPNSGQLNLTAKPGAEHQVIYRNADGTWVAIFIGGNDLVWIPAAAINTYLPGVPVQPTRIDGSSLTVTTPANIAPSAPTGVTGRILVDGLRLRKEPNVRAEIITSIPFGTTVPVLGRNAARTFLKVDFNGTVGWVSSGFVRLSTGRLSALPVVS
jgi:hypothetical protein